MSASRAVTWWLSFADPDKKNGFLGVVIVEASCFGEAVDLAWDMGINPGGEVRGYVIESIDQRYLNRLVRQPEVYEIGCSVRKHVGH